MESLRLPARPRSRHSLVWWVLLAGSLPALMVGATISRTLPSDGFYDLWAGREILRHGFSATDPWSFFGAGRTWVDQQWLAQILYFATERMGGLGAVSLLSALLVGASVGILAAILAAYGTPPALTGSVAFVLALMAETNAIVRAQSFGYCLFAVALALLLAEWHAPSRRRRLALLAVTLLWANLHGSVVGFVPVVGIAWLWRARCAWRAGDRRATAELVASIAAVCIASVTTPYGIAIAGYYRGILDNTALHRFEPEWRPASITDPLEVVFFVALAAAIVAIAFALRRRIRPSLPVAAGVAVFGYSAIGTRRSEIWFVFFAAVLIAEVVRGAAPDAERADRARVRPQLAIPLGGLALATLAGILFLGTPAAYDAVPLRAIAIAAQVGGPHARICADNESVSTLQWLYPATRGRIAFDARFELYSPAQIGAIRRFLFDPGSRLPSQFASCDVLLAETVGGHARLARTIRALPGYRVVYDVRHEGIVAVRRAGA